MQGRTFKGKVLLAVLVVLAHVSNGEHLGNASCANDDNQALLQARVKTACSPDVTPPVPVVPADIEVVNAPDECFAVVTYTSPTATDDCDPSPFIEQSGGRGSGSEFPVGSTTETFTATDATGNFESGSFHVEVMDDQDPDMTPVPADIIVNTAPGQCTAVVTFATPTATDNCPGAMIDLTAGKESGSTFDLGVTAQTFTATDASGNSLSDIFHVVVNDNENPGITGLPSSSTHGNDAGQCGAVVNYAAPTATDNCPPATIARTSGPSSGDLFPVGATPVTFTATDSSSNTFSDTFTVTVNDDEAPSAPSVPANIEVPNDPSKCEADVSYATPTATDNCALASVDLTSGSGPGSFPVGPATTETWTATDTAGNVASSSFTVKVNDVEDPSAPIVPANIVVNNDAGKCGADVSYATPTATDNCAVTVDLTSGSGPGSFSVGPATTETWTATDDAGNTASSSFTVQVNDNEPPVPSVPANIVVSNDAGKCLADVSYATPTATDNCAVDSVVQTSGSGPGSFSVGPATTETWTATDNAGNTASSSFTVQVNDDEPPVPSVPANIVVNNDAGLCGADVSYATPTATDNCAVATVVRTSGSGPGSFSVGPATTETWTATDVFGNTASSSFTVQVNDVEAPVPSVPANIVVNNAPGVCEAVVTYTAPTVTDNCGATIALTGGPSSGSSVPVGSTDVTFTATDAAGNTGSGTFTVTVQDTEAPALEVEDIDVESCSPTTVTFSPTASDNCPGVQVSCTPSSGSEFPVGETQVICTAADGAGGQTQDTFNVLVECVASDPPPDGTTQAPTYYRKHRGNTVQRVQSHFRDIRKNMKNIRKKVRHHIKKWLGD